MIRAVLFTLLLSGCSYFRRRVGRAGRIIVRPPDLYTRPEIDAINAETQCRTLADRRCRRSGAE